MNTPYGKSPPPCERWGKVEKAGILSENRLSINAFWSFFRFRGRIAFACACLLASDKAFLDSVEGQTENQFPLHQLKEGQQLAPELRQEGPDCAFLARADQGYGALQRRYGSGCGKRR